MEPAPLIAVALVFQSKPECAGLPQIVSAVSLFLDNAVELPLHVACKFGSIVLLDRIWSYCDANDTEKSTGAPWTLRKYLRTDPHYMQYQFTLSLMEAEDLNNAELARWLVAKFPEATVTMDMVASTVYCGSLEVLQVVYGRSEVDPGSQSDDILEDGVRNRHTGVVEWLYTQFLPSPWQQTTALDVACIGNVAMAEWLLDHGATWWTSDLPTGPLSITEELGSVEMLQWLDEHGRLKSIRGLVVKGAACRFIDAVYWLLDRGVKDSDEEEEFIAEIRFATHTAASNGDLSLAKYLHSRAFIPADVESRVLQRDQDQKRLRPFSDNYDLGFIPMVPSQAILEASKKGFLDVVQWLYKEFGDDPDLFNNKRSYPPDGSNTLIMDEAARNGHLNVLQYLHEVQVAMLSKKRKRSDTQVRAASVPKCTSNAMDGAATNGHLTVVQWLHNNRSEGCSARAMFDAARNGHLEVVEWLFTNRPRDLEERTWMIAMGYAAGNGHLEVVKYLHRKIESSKDEVNRAVLRGSITLDLLQRNTAMDDAARSGNLELVKWLHFNTKVGCTTAAMDQAALYGHVHILKWLHLNRTEGCTVKASEYAAGIGDLRVLQWLYSQRPTVCSSKAFDSAAMSGYFEVVLFLHSHYAAQLIIDPNYIADNDLRAWVEETNNVQ